jgi:hypothetical protein
MNKTYLITLIIILGLIIIGVGFLIFQRNYQGKELKIKYLENQNSEKTLEDNDQINNEVNLLNLARKIAGFDKEMSYLVLFQNNLELRPTGGFISSFATVKVTKAQLEEFEFYDTAFFDLELSQPTNIAPPMPINKYLWVENWQFRDGNWSPDFPTSANKMIELYNLQGGQETFDGVIAITPAVLESLLEIYGPLDLPEYDLVIHKDNFLLTLEQHIEIDYRKQGIQRFDRKNILKDIAQILIEKVIQENPFQLFGMLDLAQEHLNQKDILLYFKDNGLQKNIQKMNWDGRIRNFEQDCFMVVDSNVNSFKADYFIRRNLNYFIDFSQEMPTAKLIINYHHTAQEKSWLTRDYNDWLRVYVPQGSWFNNIKGLSTEPQYGEEFNKTIMAGLVKVPVGNHHQVVLDYTLPQHIEKKPYKLLIQRQAGIGALPVKIEFIGENGLKENINETILTDKIFEF